MRKSEHPQLNTIFLKDLYGFYHTCVCVSTCANQCQVPNGRPGHQIPLSCSYRQLWVAWLECWVPNSGSYARAMDVFKHWALALGRCPQPVRGRTRSLSLSSQGLVPSGTWGPVNHHLQLVYKFCFPTTLPCVRLCRQHTMKSWGDCVWPLYLQLNFCQFT